jgi:hypothetical protein
MGRGFRPTFLGGSSWLEHANGNGSNPSQRESDPAAYSDLKRRGFRPTKLLPRQDLFRLAKKRNTEVVQ